MTTPTLSRFAVPAWLAALVSVAIPGQGMAQTVIDCPLRDEPYSIDSPLIDVLLKPEARGVLLQQVPTLLQGFPADFITRTDSPAFAAIVTPRGLAGDRPVTTQKLATLDQALRALPVSAEDRQSRCARYDIDRPDLVIPTGKPRILVFEKITGFRDDASVRAASAALRGLAKRHGWALVLTDRAGVFTPQVLAQFAAVVWNNVSGDALTVSQRKAFRTYIETGGGFVGVHGAGGDPAYFWDWYADTLIGARFIGHPSDPQFQEARIAIEGRDGIAKGLDGDWSMTDEWYSFKANPRTAGARVLATLDEHSYTPGKKLQMGDHPIAWTRCVGDGRSFYSAIGHRPETYSDAHHLALLERAILWAAGTGPTQCRAGKSSTP